MRVQDPKRPLLGPLWNESSDSLWIWVMVIEEMLCKVFLVKLHSFHFVDQCGETPNFVTVDKGIVGKYRNLNWRQQKRSYQRFSSDITKYLNITPEGVGVETLISIFMKVISRKIVEWIHLDRCCKRFSSKTSPTRLLAHTFLRNFLKTRNPLLPHPVLSCGRICRNSPFFALVKLVFILTCNKRRI